MILLKKFEEKCDETNQKQIFFVKREKHLYNIYMSEFYVYTRSLNKLVIFFSKFPPQPPPPPPTLAKKLDQWLFS